ncbi:MAG: NADH:flavin oxidoreductase/NADH oxidase, partial [Mucilaginibacter polytrichastri]|nr:NADH:flavin oxidoreductase/NADH oxidase [Mucilaginibacter polytrichastri]
SSEDGFASDWHLVHLGSRAIGGAGLIFTEAIAVSPEGRISPQDLGIWKDEHIPMLKRITGFLHAHGAKAGTQLAHAGRKASTYTSWLGKGQVPEEKGGWKPLAPSPVPFSTHDRAPAEMSMADIHKLISDFGSAAARAEQAGFDVVEIHAAHGYLINEFLSPKSNLRTDEYGGSFENRIRVLLEVIDTVRQSWPQDKPLFVRISATEWVGEGWSVDDSVKLARILKDRQVDLVDCSSGGNVPDAKIPMEPLYQTPFAERIKKEGEISTGAVGLITKAEEADAIIREGRADLVFMAREFLRDPYFPLHAAKTLGADIEWPVQYERAKK